MKIELVKRLTAILKPHRKARRSEDILFQHSGPVLASTRDKTLDIEADEHGLKVCAHLGDSETTHLLYALMTSGPQTLEEDEE